jgi:hypothetical protein
MSFKAPAISAGTAYAIGGAVVLGGLGYMLLAPKQLTAKSAPAIVPGAPVAPLTAEEEVRGRPACAQCPPPPSPRR